MNMKKAYISPLSETRSISAEGIIATSDMTINSNTPLVIPMQRLPQTTSLPRATASGTQSGKPLPDPQMGMNMGCSLLFPVEERWGERFSFPDVGGKTVPSVKKSVKKDISVDIFCNNKSKRISLRTSFYQENQCLKV